MIASKVGRRGQITLPREIRRLLNLRQGDRVMFRKRDDTVIVEPMPLTLVDLRGSVKVNGQQDFCEIHRKVSGPPGFVERTGEAL